MDLNAVRIFVAVLQAGSLTQASERLNIPIATLSRKISELEKQVGRLCGLETYSNYIDDFGTGYSSMSYLKKLPIDTLKIDREFIKELESDEDSKSITGAIIALSKSLKLTTVAEGVENEEQRLILGEKNCDMMQGYLYSKPLSLEDLLKFLS